jgi:hypothetical protein
VTLGAAAHLDQLPQVGIPLGLLIGVLSATVSVLFLRTLQVVRRQVRDVVELAAEIVAIPSLWLGSPFASAALSDVQPSQILSSYLITLALVYSLIMYWPLVKLIIATGAEIGGDDND